jgi:hypothetical protein
MRHHGHGTTRRDRVLPFVHLSRSYILIIYVVDRFRLRLDDYSSFDLSGS